MEYNDPEFEELLSDLTMNLRQQRKKVVGEFANDKNHSVAEAMDTWSITQIALLILRVQQLEKQVIEITTKLNNSL